MADSDFDHCARIDILWDYAGVRSWRLLADMDKYKGINFVTLRRYAHGDPIVNEEHREILGLPTMVQAPACPTCGGACTYDCGKQRVTAKNGTGQRSRSKRAPTIELALSDLDRAAQRLSERTGKKWSYE